MMYKECTKCIHKEVCKTAESCDGYVSGCKHFKEEKHGRHHSIWGGGAWLCSECETLVSPEWKVCPVCEAILDGGNDDA